MSVLVKRTLNIGAISAEEDDYFLQRCFVETNHSNELADVRNPHCIALGRTGSGKSAALIKILDKKLNSTQIKPEDLSLNYISNSTIIKYLEDLGINMDIFYQLLWRHILVVELLKLKKQFHDEASTNRWFANFVETFRPNKKRQAALDYLKQFGNSFWLDTEMRVREVVSGIERSISDEVGFDLNTFFLKFKSSDGQTENINIISEIVNKAQRAVNSVQLQQLNEIIEFLSEDVFKDRMQNFYLIIDDLDTDWVHDSIRFKLVRALIETIKKFRKITNVKIIISLRADLLETVIMNTSVKGFQTEKYEDMMLRIDWSKQELKDVMDKRINQIFKSKHTKDQVWFEDIFPGKIGDSDLFSYMLERSLFRPRDLIVFVNECFAASENGSTSVSAKAVRTAEISYSRKRMRSLADEWRGVFGDLEAPLRALGRLPVRFSINDVDDKILEELCIEVVAGDQGQSGRFATECNVLSQKTRPSYSQLRRTFIEIMYIIGAIGFRRNSGNPYEWSFKNEPMISSHLLIPDTIFAIHPMLHREFNLRSDATSLNG